MSHLITIKVVIFRNDLETGGLNVSPNFSKTQNKPIDEVAQNRKSIAILVTIQITIFSNRPISDRLTDQFKPKF